MSSWQLAVGSRQWVNGSKDSWQSVEMLKGSRQEAVGSRQSASPHPLLLTPYSLLFLLFLAPSPGHTQILEHEEARFFGDEPFFNEEFIKRNDIREIRAPVSKKRQMDRIRKTGTEYHYEFGRNGRLVRQYRIFVHSDSVTDTTFIHYEYDEEGRLMRVRRNDLHGFYAYAYERDSLGRVTKERYLRIENEGPSRYEFEPGREFVIDEESYRYQRPSDTLMIQEYYNSKGRIYRRKFYHRDSLGYLKKVRSRYIVTNKVGVTRYEYDRKGRVVNRYEDANVSDTTQERYEFVYDSIGNLMKWNLYRNGKRIHHHDYLYRDTTMLLDAEIEKEEETLLITITRFKYRFWDADPKGREEEGVSSKE